MLSLWNITSSRLCRHDCGYVYNQHILLLLFAQIGKSAVEVVTSTNKVLSAMTTNPIYEGLVYDSIVQPQLNTLPTGAQEASTMATGSMTHSRSDPLESTDHHIVSETNDNSDTLASERYVSQFNRSRVPTSNSLSVSPTLSPPHTDNVDVSWSPQGICIQPATVTTLKNSGDKHFFTQDLSLNQADQGAKDDEGNEYIVMNPIGTISGSLHVRKSDKN